MKEQRVRYRVKLNGETFDDVYYDDYYAPNKVKQDLIDNEGYEKDIEVERVPEPSDLDKKAHKAGKDQRGQMAATNMISVESHNVDREVTLTNGVHLKPGDVIEVFVD